MARVGVDPTRRTTKNGERTTRATVKNWGTYPMVKAERKTHQTSRETKERTLALEVLEPVTEMLDGTHPRTKTNLELIEMSPKNNETGKSSSWSLLTSEA